MLKQFLHACAKRFPYVSAMLKPPIMAVWLKLLAWREQRPVLEVCVALSRRLSALWSGAADQAIVARRGLRFQTALSWNKMGLRRLWRKLSGDTSLRILHGPVNVGNQPWTLSRAERALGHKSDLVQNYGTWIGYAADRTLSELGQDTRETRAAREDFLQLAPLSYDVIHYYFGRSFSLWDDLGMSFGGHGQDNQPALRDVLQAKRLGRRLIMTLQGCDARIAGRSNAINAHTPCAEGRCRFYESCIRQIDNSRLAMMEALLPLMDRVFYLNPELGHFVPNGQFLPYGNVDVMASQLLPPKTTGRLRIVHAPSDGSTKGTPAILAGLEALRSRFDFELVLVEGKPHAEAMEIYKSADIAIDQILFGWYGGFAVEMMAMGKPVMCYIREEDKKFVPAAMLKEMPILNIHPDRLVEDIAAIFSERAEWSEWSRKSIAFAQKWHNPDFIAKYLVDTYRNEDRYNFAEYLINEGSNRKIL